MKRGGYERFCSLARGRQLTPEGSCVIVGAERSFGPIVRDIRPYGSAIGWVDDGLIK